MSTPDPIHECRHAVARVAASHLDRLPLSERIMVCLGIASLYPDGSQEAVSARQHAEALREVERQQLLLTGLLNS
jgi:hypothetical protein